MSNENSRVGKIVETIDKYFPAEIDPISIKFGLWKMVMDSKIVMLKRDGFSEEFINKYIEHQCDSFAKELAKEREA
jgi:hypothetical protein